MAAALTSGFCTKVVQFGVEDLTGVVQVTDIREAKMYLTLHYITLEKRFRFIIYTPQ